MLPMLRCVHVFKRKKTVKRQRQRNWDKEWSNPQILTTTGGKSGGLGHWFYVLVHTSSKQASFPFYKGNDTGVLNLVEPSMWTMETKTDYKWLKLANGCFLPILLDILFQTYLSSFPSKLYCLQIHLSATSILYFLILRCFPFTLSIPRISL